MTASQQASVAIIVPAYRADDNLRRCLSSIAAAAPPADEFLVVIDGGDSAACSAALQAGARTLVLPIHAGPAVARNAGAQSVSSDLLFFIDSDVLIPRDAVAQVRQAFLDHPEAAAIFGSYDDAPDAPNLLSQYKNLLHHYVHQRSREDASTFWTGCGAIRADAFRALNGFDSCYRIPCMEDIELGYRLRASGRQIRLVKSLQVKHLKHWTARSLLHADLIARALPWSQLILTSGVLINDLNLTLSSRLSALLVYGLLLTLGLALHWPVLLWLALLQALALLVLNADLYRFFLRKRGLLFTLAVIPWHWFYFFYGALAFAIALVQYHVRRLCRPGAAPRRPASRPRETP